jgi:hypothetical protein
MSYSRKTPALLLSMLAFHKFSHPAPKSYLEEETNSLHYYSPL